MHSEGIDTAVLSSRPAGGGRADYATGFIPDDPQTYAATPVAPRYRAWVPPEKTSRPGSRPRGGRADRALAAHGRPPTRRALTRRAAAGQPG
jgi:hypothetical protein